MQKIAAYIFKDLQFFVSLLNLLRIKRADNIAGLK